MKVVVLCGGLGTRLREETEFRPKPMVEVGGRPILWHIMKIYAHNGFHDFVLCLGYRGNMIKEYFLNYEAMNNDFTICLGQQIANSLQRPCTKSRDFQRHAGRNRPEHDDRRPLEAHPEIRRRRYLHGDLWRRRRATSTCASCWRSTRATANSRQSRPLPPTRVSASWRLTTAGQVQKIHREAAHRRLGQRRLFRVSSARCSIISTATSASWSASRWNDWPPKAS